MAQKDSEKRTIMIPDLSPADFDYELPKERIAKYPLPDRDQSRLLVYHKGEISESRFSGIAGLLEHDDLLVVNNTRVIRARLFFYRETGARIEVFCLEPHDPPDYDRMFRSGGPVIWKCLIGNARKWKEKELAGKVLVKGQEILLRCERVGEESGEWLIRFSWDGDVAFGQILDAAGKVPLPPYLEREPLEQDAQTYQTLFARYEGSVAAPTAALHFSDRLISQLKKKVDFAEVTLHVGAGTFRPVKSDSIRDHIMHTEHIGITREALERMRHTMNRIVAIGTTTMRTLESLSWLAESIHKGEDVRGISIGQWTPYGKKPVLSRNQVLEVLLEHLDREDALSLQVATQLIIVPGFPFRMVDGLVTNFHMPRSSLLMLVGAFIGEDWKKVYRHALNNDFRFLSYGDGSILFP